MGVPFFLLFSSNSLIDLTDMQRSGERFQKKRFSVIDKPDNRERSKKGRINLYKKIGKDT